MNREDFVLRLDDSCISKIALSEKKSNDYATSDILSNFKRVSELARLLNLNVQTKAGYCLLLCVMKIDRISNLLSKNTEPSNESLQDSIMDLSLYVDLLGALLSEEG